MSEVRIDVHRDATEVTQALRRDVREGLTAEAKWLPSKWLYDARGSELFDRITTVPEYYPTRAEREILRSAAPEIAAVTGMRTLVELGSGSGEKTRLLLDAGTEHGGLRRFVPLDVSSSALSASVDAIASEYPALRVDGVVADFTEPLDSLPGTAPRLVAFLGGTIGNFLPAERAKFFSSVRSVLGEGEWFLLGTDLVKDADTLVAAYDDAEGVTAEFNRNVLRVLNDRLGADFDPAAFEHVAHWDDRHEWIEMRLRALRPMTVTIPGADLTVRFAEGEYVRTEISAKFRPDAVRAELADAGFTLRHWWTDPEGRFAVSLSEART
ncbi:L-histidine N(alpha)-methyltransferase [Saccharomonospora xinjiangensis]|uniref:Histidine N-alpha-methyltransferase n=1 Tax=Saccharomonospora xinjiangensis XJ-54 TaxID=882086 RepID=I0V7R7_9PSEU|nr:L-histidine N(alpha)-methyltransferase [Saccharomonospora xinjiangensis]EID56170.1 putative methyltransferase [Saccharomonospora xinjiangensis XJ-54]